MSGDRVEHLITVRARAIYVNMTLTMVAIGIHLFMALYGLSVFLETPAPQRKGRKRYIAASFAITALFSLSGSLDMANYFQTLFKSTSPGHWQEMLLVNFNKHWKSQLSYTGVGLFISIGDALLVYRCYIICAEFWWATILPMIASLSALVLFLKAVYTGDTITAFSEFSASSLLTVSTNIILTSLITFRLLRARRQLEKILPSADMQVYTGVIGVLIESAAPLTIFGIIAAITQQLGSKIQDSPGFHVCNYLFQGLFYASAALSPHMIIFRVTTGRSFTQFSTPKDGALFNPIQFAHRTAESSFLQSMFDGESIRNPHRDTERGLNASDSGHNVDLEK